MLEVAWKDLEMQQQNFLTLISKYFMCQNCWCDKGLKLTI